MKIFNRDLKQGIVKVQAESADDLWYLHAIVDEHDKLRGDSEYKEKLSGAGEKSRVTRRKVWVVVDVEKSEFDEHTAHLRISGPVIDGSEEVPRGNYHSIDISEGSVVTIKKERWLDYHLDKLEEAEKSGSGSTLLLLFDREQAIFVMLKPSGYEVVLELKGDVNKKGMDEQKTKSFYKEIHEKLTEYRKRHEIHTVVAASPSFWKEYLKKEMPQEDQKGVVFTSVSSVDKSAINELLQREELQHALQGERAARETEIVAKAMEALGKDMLSYGFADVKEAIGHGNVTMLIVTENKVKKDRAEERFKQLEALMRQASDMNAKVHMLSTEETQRKIDGLGGIVALKRWQG